MRSFSLDGNIYPHTCIAQSTLPANISKEEALKRIDSVIKYVNDTLDQAEKQWRKENPFSFTPTPSYSMLNARQVSQLSVRLKQTILDMSPAGSEYNKYASSFLPPYTYISVAQLFGTLRGLREDYANDFLKGFNEMIDAELFSDILEQAEYLLSQNYVRASAVVAGVALESHLRKLAVKNSIPITKDGGGYIKADFLNGELNKNNIIDKTISKSITSWLGIRNDAAHPDAKEINAGLVGSMISGIRIFIEKYPA